MALCSKLNIGTEPSLLEWPWEIRPPNKNFYCYQTFLIKRGWVLRWEGHARLKCNYNALKARFKKCRSMREGL